jgi:hypothetical protein
MVVDAVKQSVSCNPAAPCARWRGNAYPGELGAAIRQLGFNRERRRHDEGGFLAAWIGF